MNNNSPIMVSYLFVDDFINKHKVEVCSHSLLEEFPSSTTRMTVYLSNTYIYLHRHDGREFLIVELFREEYKVYVFEWPWNLKEFITIINNLDIFSINIGDSYVNPYHVTVTEERKVLETVLNSLVVDRKYMISKYGLK